MAWWAIITVPNGEFRACDELVAAGLETFLPVKREMVRRARTPRRSYRQRMMGEQPRTVYDKTPTEVAELIWPRYMFARNDLDEINVDDLQQRRKCWHVANVVKNVGKALQVPESVVAQERAKYGGADTVVAAGRPVALAEDDKFIIQGTPFEGFVATIISLAKLDNKEPRVSAWIELLGTRRNLELDYRDVGRIIHGSQGESVAA